jgi:hypothetical protein
MKTIQSIFILSLLIFPSSCGVIYTTQITNKDNTNICALHNIKMHKTIVKIQHGRFSTDRNDKNLYPNAKKMYYKGCIKGRERFAIVYHCKKCDKLKQKAHQ